MLVCPASGRALLPASLACGPCPPRSPALQLWGGTTGLPFTPAPNGRMEATDHVAPRVPRAHFGLGHRLVLAVRSGWPLRPPFCEHAPRQSSRGLCTAASARARRVRTGVLVTPAKPQCQPLARAAPARLPGVWRDGAAADLAVCLQPSASLGPQNVRAFNRLKPLSSRLIHKQSIFCFKREHTFCAVALE